MTIDKSLRVKAGAISNRNVLTRAERIAKLKETERWKEGDRVLGLPKVRVLKLAIKKKKKAPRPRKGPRAPPLPAAGARCCRASRLPRPVPLRSPPPALPPRLRRRSRPRGTTRLRSRLRLIGALQHARQIRIRPQGAVRRAARRADRPHAALQGRAAAGRSAGVAAGGA